MVVLERVIVSTVAASVDGSVGKGDCFNCGNGGVLLFLLMVVLERVIVSTVVMVVLLLLLMIGKAQIGLIPEWKKQANQPPSQVAAPHEMIQINFVRFLPILIRFEKDDQQRYLKEIIYRNKPRNLMQLRVAITTFFQGMAEDLCRRMVGNIRVRLKEVIRQQGGHIEHVLHAR
ncbi:hypothetical protein ANN_06275 [Periplaneta americana]|uniref:Uncharacterized protein n=1 Tax=Periplaneta americana TaxID=6978 RepID=A0ABQ8TEV8_PERAM|nr:hypothetical protein ANN_06275 [Periplaneta americana]